MAGWLASKVMVTKGYRVSNKSVLSPTSYVKWLGKEVDLDALWISNTISVITRLVARLVVIYSKHISAKHLMSIIGLICQLGTPATGRLPFLG